jgi:hypothetical protein
MESEGGEKQMADPLPPDHLGAEWIERNAAMVRQALGNPKVRARVIALATGDDEKRKRRARLEELERELDGMQVTWRIGEES